MGSIISTLSPRTGEPRPGGAGAAPTFPGGKGLPGTVTATARPGECAELPKGCSARRDPEQLGGARAAAPRRGLRGPGSSSEGLGGGSAEGAAGREQLGGARAEEEAPCGGGCAVPGAARGGSGGGGSAEGAAGRERESNSAGSGAQGAGDTAQDPASPRDRQRPGGPRTARTLLPQLSRSAAPPRSLQAL